MASMAAYLFIFAHFGNIVCTNNNRQVNITHVVSKETFELDKSLNLTEQAENGTLAPDLTVPTEQPERYSSTTATTETAEASVPTINELKTTDRSTFTPSNPEVTRQGASSVPLPVSGSLPQPVSDVSAVCPCNLQRAQCDVNCCCDPDCSQELALFTQCSVQKVSGDVKLCSQDAAVHTLTVALDGLSRVSTSVQRETNPDVLCIQSANYEEGMSFITPEIPSEQNFDSLFDRFAGFSFGLWRGSASQRPAQGNSPGYTYGDLIQTLSPAGQRDFLRLPTSAGSSHCLDTNPAAFLKDQSSSCVRNVVLAEDCTALEALNLRSYTGAQVFSGKDKDAESVPVAVESVTLQSLEGTHTQVVTDSAASAYQPEFLPSAEVCNRAVLQVKYTVSFGDAGQIVKVLASFLLGAIDKTRVPLQQQFHITFVQESKSDATLRSSGNPGYVVGLPLVAGWKTAEGVIQSSAPDGSLTVLKSSADQDCLSGSTQRSPVLFGIDTVSGCTFRLEDGANCSLISEAVLGRLKGQNFPDCVASFGNSFPQKPMDWIPIENRTTPMVTQGCSVPVSYHLEVRWTKFGTLVNPQAQIVSVTEVIGFNTSALPSASTGTGVVSVSTSVGFVDISAPASPGYRAPPTITAKLPFDFFFPFV